jgi:hypothetical protein
LIDDNLINLDECKNYSDKKKIDKKSIIFRRLNTIIQTASLEANENLRLPSLYVLIV